MSRGAMLLLLAAAAAGPEIRYFEYQRPIRHTPQSAGQTCLALDPAIFSHAAPNLADLRLYRDGAEAPWALRVAAPVEGGEQRIAPLNLGQRGGETVFDAAMPEGTYSDVELAVTGHDFLATVEVAGSQTPTRGEATQLGSYTIFDLTRQKLGRSTVLHLPESNFRFLHFRVTGPIAPESVAGITVERLAASPPRYVTVGATSVAVEKGHATVVEIRAPANAPVDRIVFVPGATPAAFSRAVSVTAAASSPPAETPEPTVAVAASGNLLRLHRDQDGHRIDEERLSIDASEGGDHGAQTWTARIENGDDAPIALETVRLEMLERDLCFDAAAGSRYTLYYGDPALSAPSYDYRTLFVAQPNAALSQAGPEEANPAYQPRPDSRPFTERYPALLWAALVAVVALLGIVALRTAKRPPAEPE